VTYELNVKPIALLMLRALTGGCKSACRTLHIVHNMCINPLRRRDSPRDELESKNAKRTARAETPSGRNRQRSTHCPHCDRRNARDNSSTTSEAQQRLGGCEGAYAEHNRGPAQRNCAQGRNGEVGLMPNFAPEAIANAFLSKQGGLGRLTQMQVQKLVYIAHGWMLGLAGQPLVGMEPEAWDRGPVFPTMRDRIKFSGSSPIRSLIHENDGNPFARLGEGNRGSVFEAQMSPYEQSVLDHVWSRYGSFSAFKLSDLTHLPSTPWSQVYKDGVGRNSPISNELIQGHYNELAKRAA
jgi:uncharacterized phage-associated protein